MAECTSKAEGERERGETGLHDRLPRVLLDTSTRSLSKEELRRAEQLRKDISSAFAGSDKCIKAMAKLKDAEGPSPMHQLMVNVVNESVVSLQSSMTRLRPVPRPRRVKETRTEVESGIPIPIGSNSRVEESTSSRPSWVSSLLVPRFGPTFSPRQPTPLDQTHREVLIEQRIKLEGDLSEAIALRHLDTAASLRAAIEDIDLLLRREFE